LRYHTLISICQKAIKKGERAIAKKITISILPEKASREFDEGTLLIDALADMGLALRTPCGGKGHCGKCGVYVTGRLSAPAPVEERFIARHPKMRLACQAAALGDVEVRHEARSGAPHRSLPGVDPYMEYGLAVDIGTTTMQTSLVELGGTRSFTLDAFLNPHRRYGHDVIGRLSASGEPAVYARLVSMLREAVRGSLEESCRAIGLPAGAVRRIVFSGNTTMLYFLFGLDVGPIGVFPYTAKRVDFDGFSAGELGLSGFPNARVTALPAASAFLGADLVGGLALTDTLGFSAHSFFIDIGTNGEMFVRNGSGKIFAASCAMGPALEGMNISYGMTADEGAINHLHVEGGAVRYAVIGGDTPQGICGTGIIDALAILLDENLLKKDGAFVAPGDVQSRLFPDGITMQDGQKQIRLCGDIVISQKDVRSIQLAKGASLSASHILLREAGCDPLEILHVFIAGAFGENLDIENFKKLKFISDFKNAEYRFLGNSSLQAAARACGSDEFMARSRALRDSLSIIELSAHPDFNDEFVRCLDF